MNAEPISLPVAGTLLLALSMAVPAAADDAKAAAKDKPAARIVPRLLLPPAASGHTRITWRNGEELRGELESAGGGVLSWKTPLFAAPLKLRQDVIRRFDYSTGFQRAEGSFRLALADGSHLTGELQKISDTTITFNSATCGVVTVNRDQAVAIERISGEGIVTAGPLSILPDKPVGRGEGGNAATPLFLAAAGRAASPGFNLITHRTLDLPAKSIADLHIRTEGVPDFKFTLASASSSVSVETWGDELVLLFGENFVSAGNKFKDDDRAAHIRLAWDQAGGRAALYGADGTLWAETGAEKKTEEPKKEEPKKEGNWLRKLFGAEEAPREEQATRNSAKPSKGVTMHNKGSGIVVERFSLSEWNGSPPVAVLAETTFVETGSEFIPGEPVSAEGDTLQVKSPGGEVRALPLASVRCIRWQRPVKTDRDPAQTDLWFTDGNLLRGRLTGVADGKAVLETAFSAAPVTAALARGRTAVLPEPDKKEDSPALAKLDIIRAGDTTLHGTIQPQGGELPHFLPVGAEAPLPPVAARDLTITRSLADDEKFERAPALLHVKTNETLPVTLQEVSRDKITFTWDAASQHTLDSAQLHAVQFSTPAADGKGFDGTGWRALSEDGKGITRKGDAVVLQPGAGIGHPYMLQGGDINFRMSQDDGRGLTSIRIRLFCQGTERNSSGLNLLIGDFGGDIYCGEERGEGQLTNSNQVSSNGGAANIRISFPGDKVELWVNKVKVVSTSLAMVAARGQKGGANLKNVKKAGTGIIIETASLWGNQIGSAVLMDLSMDTSPCMAGPPSFAEDARREALLLPRLRREDPPRHVLIGRNGDLLRGEIEGMTTTHLAFRTGMENFKVPVERVAAAVWLIVPPKPAPAKDEPPAPEKPKKEKPDEILAPGGGGFHFTVVKVPLPAAQKKEKKPAAEQEQPKVEEPPPEPVRPGVQWLDLTNGGRLALKVESWNADVITGEHPLLGKCRIPRALVHHLTLKEPPPPAALTALADWKLQPTADPAIPEGDEKASPFAGKDAPDFKLPQLEGSDFSLSKAKGKVVVLDFWATWCGPCVKSLPGLIETMAGFPPEDVAFLAVNQGETKDQVKKFLTARSWQMPVAFDADQKVAQKFGVEGIPHTVVIDRMGKIAFTQTGLTPNGDKKIADAVKKALEAPAPEKEKPEEKDKPEDDSEEPLLPEPKGI